MTARELIDLAAQNNAAVACVLLMPVALTLLLSQLHGRDGARRAPWRYLYAVLIYATCIPGVFAVLLTGYTVFFTHDNLLDQSLIVYVLPIATMVATVALMARTVDFVHIPGFDRLSGMLTLLAVTFAILFLLAKTRIWIVFGGSLATLACVGVGLYVTLQMAAQKAFRTRP